MTSSHQPDTAAAPATEEPTGVVAPPRPVRRPFGPGSWALAGAAVVVLVLGIVFSQRFGRDPSFVTSPLIGTPAPSVSLPYLEQPGELTLNSLRGDIVVVNFWASWCFPCRIEHPLLTEAATIYRDQEVTFVSVNYQDTNPEAVTFLDELGRSQETLYVVDPDSRTALEFGVLGLPETFFIDENGIIVGKVSGALTGPLLTGTLNRIILGETIGVVKTGEVQNRP